MMAGARKTKRANFKDSDFIFLHREPQGLGVPKVVDGSKQYAMTVRDFFSDVLTGPVTDTDAENAGVENLLMRPVMYDAGLPEVGDVDRIVASVVMFVGDYTIANASAAGGVALNVTVTNATLGAFDTPGTIVITGTDIDDQVITETVIPATNATVATARAFKTVTGVEGVGWISDGTDDTIEVGFGELIGLPDLLINNTVLFAVFNAIREATAPTVTFSTTVLALNTVDLNSALDGSAVQIYYLV